MKLPDASDVDIDSLIEKMGAFMNTMHHIKLDLELEPKKAHVATCINYSDLNQMRKEFLREMVVSITRYVYSRNKQKLIVKESIAEDREEADAWSSLHIRAKEKFRPSNIQGQFSELLLFNLLQFHFRAIPLLRKMKITTNVGLERNGADAIHIAKVGNNKILYLGEAKTYTSGFKKAFKEALDSIVDAHKNHRNELDLYKFEDFLEPELEQIGRKYISGKSDLEVHLVCIISFCCGDELVGKNRDETLKLYIDKIQAEVAKIKPTDYPGTIEPIKARINYIVFPVSELEKLLDEFKKMLGI